VFNVMIAAEGDRGSAARRALRISDFDSGEPVTMVRPGRWVRLPEVCTRATAV
jgi:hypothetical protein